MKRLYLQYLRSLRFLISLCVAGCATQVMPLDTQLTDAGRALLQRQGFLYTRDKRDLGPHILPYLRPDGRFRLGPLRGMLEGVSLGESPRWNIVLCLLSATIYPCQAPSIVTIVQTDPQGLERTFTKTIENAYFGVLVIPFGLIEGWRIDILNGSEYLAARKDERSKAVMTIVNELGDNNLR